MGIPSGHQDRHFAAIQSPAFHTINETISHQIGLDRNEKLILKFLLEFWCLNLTIVQKHNYTQISPRWERRTMAKWQQHTKIETTTAPAAAAPANKKRKTNNILLYSKCMRWIRNEDVLLVAAKLNESQYQNVNGNFFNESQRRAEQVEYHSQSSYFLFLTCLPSSNVYLWFAVRYINKAARKIKYNGTKSKRRRKKNVVYTHLHLSAQCFGFVSIWILNTIYANF